MSADRKTSALRRRTTGFLSSALLLALPAAPALAQPNGAAPTTCGELVTIQTHDGTTTLYALAQPQPAQGARIALVLLAGGGGHLNFDDHGCPRSLTGDSLVRFLPLFHGAVFLLLCLMRLPIIPRRRDTPNFELLPSTPKT